MRIVFVSTYPPIECGIGAYTSFLADALAGAENEIHIVSQYGAEGRHVYPCYAPTDNGIAGKIFHSALRVTPDIVHIQHEFPLYGELEGIAALELIYRIKSTATPVIATMHTVEKEPTFRQKLIVNTMCRELDGIIVHEESHVDLLKSLYNTDPGKIFMIPHGARVMDPIPGARKKIGMPEKKKIILVAGYFRPTKGFNRIVEIFPRIAEKVPDARLLISCKLRLLEFNTYRETLLEKVENSPVKDRIQVFQGQFPQKTFDTILSASDLMVFPYFMGAQSGMMAHAMTFGKPVVSSDLPAFVDILEKSEAGFYAKTDDEFVDKIVSILTDQKIFRRLSENGQRYVTEKISWDIAADKTIKVYEKFVLKPEFNARYVFAGE